MRLALWVAFQLAKDMHARKQLLKAGASRSAGRQRTAGLLAAQQAEYKLWEMPVKESGFKGK